MDLFFEWDKNKAAAYYEKHGVSFEEAAIVFGDTLSITIDDPDHGDEVLTGWANIPRKNSGCRFY